jgi:hypothetical protein
MARKAKRTTKQNPVPLLDNAHSADFRSVLWNGVMYSFSSTQADAVKILWEHFDQAVPEVSQLHILNSIGLESLRLRDLFRSKGGTHPAFGTMIVPAATRGAFRLAAPPVKKTGRRSA